jgi:hypothetical protein
MHKQTVRKSYSISFKEDITLEYKVKLSLYLNYVIADYAMKAYGEVEV